MNSQKIKKSGKGKGGTKGNGGYTLLFAVLVSALVLAVAVSILDISRKELILTSGARDSEYAFYAADTGYECGVYNDTNSGAVLGATIFSTTTPSGTTSISCGTNADGTIFNSPITLTGSGNYGPFDFTFYIPISGKACAFVDVNKIYTAAGVSTTTISSIGYNLGWLRTDPNDPHGAADCNGSPLDSQKVDRELVTKYLGS